MKQNAVRIWEYPIPVVGISFNVKSNEEIPSDDIVCEREPENPKDPNAIAVFVLFDGQRKKIGYLAKQFAMSIHDRDLPIQGRITWRAPKLGIMIAI